MYMHIKVICFIKDVYLFVMWMINRLQHVFRVKQEKIEKKRLSLVTIMMTQHSLFLNHYMDIYQSNEIILEMSLGGGTSYISGLILDCTF